MSENGSNNNGAGAKTKKGAKRLLFGFLFVVVTIVLWRMFMWLTWRAGLGLIWQGRSGCTPTTPSGLWEHLLYWLFGYGQCGDLKWYFAVVLLLFALWVAIRAFFPSSYPPERYPIPKGPCDKDEEGGDDAKPVDESDTTS